MLRTIPLTIKQANQLVIKWHRHHKPVTGARFCIGAVIGTTVIGAAIVGRPVSTGFHPYLCAEVTRLVTNGYRNGCSFLYGACARICKEMGYSVIQTYILDREIGISLKASGWVKGWDTQGNTWQNREGRRGDQPETPKQYWFKRLRE